MSDFSNEYKAWLQNLKPGDEVAVFHGHGNVAAFYKVARVTETQIIVSGGDFVNGVRYRRDNGNRVGGSVWTSDDLHQPTEEMKMNARIFRARRMLRNTDWEKVSPDVVFKITKILTEMREQIAAGVRSEDVSR